MIECVNACAGMPRPANDIAELRAEIVALKRRYDDLHTRHVEATDELEHLRDHNEQLRNEIKETEVQRLNVKRAYGMLQRASSFLKMMCDFIRLNDERRSKAHEGEIHPPSMSTIWSTATLEILEALRPFAFDPSMTKKEEPK